MHAETGELRILSTYTGASWNLLRCRAVSAASTRIPVPTLHSNERSIMLLADFANSSQVNATNALHALAFLSPFPEVQLRDFLISVCIRWVDVEVFLLV